MLIVGNVCKLDVVVGLKVWFGGLLNIVEFKFSVIVEFIFELFDDILGCNLVDEVLMDIKFEFCVVDINKILLIYFNYWKCMMFYLLF